MLTYNRKRGTVEEEEAGNVGKVKIEANWKAKTAAFSRDSQTKSPGRLQKTGRLRR